MKANGEDLKVMQELMRHSNITTTINLYAQAFSDDAREAQTKLIELVRTAPILKAYRDSLFRLLCSNVHEA